MSYISCLNYLLTGTYTTTQKIGVTPKCPCFLKGIFFSIKITSNESEIHSIHCSKLLF